jgi:hypothetical protein
VAIQVPLDRSRHVRRRGHGRLQTRVPRSGSWNFFSSNFLSGQFANYASETSKAKPFCITKTMCLSLKLPSFYSFLREVWKLFI